MPIGPIRQGSGIRRKCKQGSQYSPKPTGPFDTLCLLRWIVRRSTLSKSIDLLLQCLPNIAVALALQVLKLREFFRAHASSLPFNVSAKTKNEIQIMSVFSQASQDTISKIAPQQHRFVFHVGIRWVIFASLLVASVAPVFGLYKWMEKSAIQKEIRYVDENHLIIAQNLSAAMERYTSDVASVVELVSDNLFQSGNLDFAQLLSDFDLSTVALVDPVGNVVKEYAGTRSATVRDMSAHQISELRTLAATDPGQPIFSGTQAFQGTPHLFVGRTLPGELIAIAVLEPRYLIELQKSIKFGERGHSMMVDQYGRVIAHPNSEWQATSKDASGLSVVQLMMAGKTGVATFFSPPMQADMISGYTHVARTGWGVMVPQPMSELVARAKATEASALMIIAIESLLLVILSYWLSSLIAKPIHNVVATAEAVSAGDLGARVPVRNNAAAISEAHLLGTSFNKLISDLETERSRLTGALDAANEGTRAKSQFLAVMSHELRTPMHGLMGVLELLDEERLEDDQRKLIKVGRLAANNMTELLNGVLSYAKLESHTEFGDIAPFNPATLAQGALDLFQPLASKRGLSMTMSVPDQMLNGYPQPISQILLNLVGNALKFTDAGSIHISSELRGSGTDQMVLLLSVTDSGIGIDENQQSRIFEEFVQIDSEIARKHQGTGLGLAIASGFAKLMNGEITVSSALGQGATFQLAVPVTDAGH
jgi:signal transduction histidine kinase